MCFDTEYILFKYSIGLNCNSFKYDITDWWMAMVRYPLEIDFSF